jgi:hypothetical protein
MSAGSYTNLLVLVGRVCQRAPGLIKDMENQLEGMSFTRKNSSFVEPVLDKIGKLVGAGPGLAHQLGLPNKVWHYLTYTDLVVVRVKDNTRQWAVCLLRDYPHTAEEASLIDEEGWVLRTKLKTALKEIGLMAGVQTEERICFRITTTRKTKDMERVYKVKPTLVVYYSGEPYFYSSLSRCLGCKDSKELPLGGRCVVSLRILRQGWEGRPHGHGQAQH